MSIWLIDALHVPLALQNAVGAAVPAKSGFSRAVSPGPEKFDMKQKIKSAMKNRQRDHRRKEKVSILELLMALFSRFLKMESYIFILHRVLQII